MKTKNTTISLKPSEIATKLVHWLNDSSFIDIQAIKTESNGNKPSDHYLAVQRQGIFNKVNTQPYTTTDDEGLGTQYNVYEGEVMIYEVGKYGDVLSDIKSSIEIYERYKPLLDSGITIRDIGNIQPIPSLSENFSTPESVIVLTLDFYSIIDNIDNGLIEEIDFTNNIESKDKNKKRLVVKPVEK